MENVRLLYQHSAGPDNTRATGSIVSPGLHLRSLMWRRDGVLACFHLLGARVGEDAAAVLIDVLRVLILLVRRRLLKVLLTRKLLLRLHSHIEAPVRRRLNEWQILRRIGAAS